MNPRALLFLGTVSLTAMPFACVLSEPSPIVKPGVRRPTILHGQEFPTTSRVLLEDPGTFYVPVEVVDPETTYEWDVLLDFPALSEAQARVIGLGRTIAGSASRPNVEAIAFDLDERLKDGRCHQITFRVGLSLAPNNPASVDSDLSTWFFVPSGKTSACVPFDGGLPDGGYDTGREAGVDP